MFALLAGAALLCAATPMAPDRQDRKAAAPAQALEQARQAVAALDRDRFLKEPAYAAQMVRQIELLEETAPEADVLQALRHLRMAGYLTTGRNADAAAVSELLIEADPNDPTSYIGAYLGQIYDGRAAGALSVVERASGAITAEEGRTVLYGLFSRDTIFDLNRSFYETKDKESRFRLAGALVRIDWPGSTRIEDRDAFRADLVRELMDRGDPAGAAAVAATIIAPSSLLDLLVLREYDPLFDANIDRAERIKLALRSYDEATAGALASSGGDLDVILARVQFLRSVGRNAEALALVQPLLSDFAAVERSGEQAFWIVNDAAYALGSLGRGTEAVQLMDRLLELDINAHPSLINMSINKGAILNDAGRHAEAFEHAKRIEGTQGKYASEFGKMWMAETAVCALAAQGRLEEARPWLERLRKQAHENEAAATRAMLCMNDLNGAEQLLLTRLAGDDPPEAVRATQRHQIKGKPSFSDMIAERWEALCERPRVDAAINKVGRRLLLPTARDYWGRY